MVFLLLSTLISKGYLQSKSCHRMFIKSCLNSFMAIVIYVDILIIENDKHESLALKQFLHS